MSDTTTVALAEAQDPKTFPGMLIAFKAQIAAALPAHINADRMARIALTAYRMTPKLAECEPASVFAGVIQSSQLGLEIGLAGRGFLVPYYNTKKRRMEAQFIPGWKGLVDLANRTGRSTVWTGAVFAGDFFEFELGDSPYCKHRPAGEDDPEKMTHVYSIGRIRGNDVPIIEVWTNERVKRHFKRYNKVGDAHYAFGAWEMYARKVPLLQVLKYLPSSPELETAMAMSYAADSGSQNLNIKDAVEGTFAPAYDMDQNGSGSAAIDKMNAEASAAPPGKEKGEPPKAPELTPELIDKKMHKAFADKDADMLDVQASMIGEIADEVRREALTKTYRELAGKLREQNEKKRGA